MENESAPLSESNRIMEELDGILEKNFRKLDQINVLGKVLSLDMVTVAALHLLTERESEFEEDENTTLQRYNRKSFLNDMTEIGFEIDDDLMNKVQAIIDNDYVKIDGKGGYHTEAPAKEFVANVNKMFPGMPGMNLVAYVIQTLEEILSGRKELDKGLEQFDKALASRGRPLTFVHLRTEKKTEKQKAEERVKQAKEREESRKASETLKKVYGEKLAALRQSVLTQTQDPMVVTKRAIGNEEIKIREISPQKVKEAQERERLEQERLERERLEQERAELQRQKEELERLAHEREEQERLEVERLERETREKEEQERLRLEQEAKAREEQERLEQERIKQQEQQKKELSIEEQIAAFQQEQATSCPLCHQGKILQEMTESNRTYFKCTNASCKFISWDKPHLFPCPQCRNPYLLEFRKPDGTLGLKCPLATCSYVQDGIGRPGEAVMAPPTMPSMSNGQASPPKKKRLVRRKRR